MRDSRRQVYGPACDPNGRAKGVGFNGNYEIPTLSPSILSQWPDGTMTHICHHFVKDGQIQYLSDCTHALAGQTMDLPDIKE